MLAKWLKSWAARTVSGSRRGPRTILKLEALEERWCPATDIWLGGYSQNWSDSQNWSTHMVPAPFDDAVFNGAYSNSDCNSMGRGVVCHSLTLTNGYTGTLHFQAPSGYAVDLNGDLELDSGAIEQDNGADINVAGNFTWTGGELNNNSAFLAQVQAKAQIIQSATAGTNLQTGDNLIQTAGTNGIISLPGGSLAFNKGAGMDLQGGSVNWADGTLKNTTGQGIINIQANATLQKTTGTDTNPTTELAIDNAGKFQLMTASLSIKGKDANGYSFAQTDGTCEIVNNAATLFVPNGFLMEGGKFWTDGTTTSLRDGDVTFAGGVISLNHLAPLGVYVGVLSCNKNVNIQGTAEFDAKVDANNAPNADRISTTGNINIAGTATLKAITVDLPAGGKVPLNKSWTILSAGGAVGGNFTNFTLDFDDGTTGKYKPNPGNPYTLTS